MITKFKGIIFVAHNKNFKFMKKLFILIVILSFINLISFGQEKKEYKISGIAFYYIENLFDTIPGNNDRDFTPESKKNYDTEKYFHKINNMSYVISQLCLEETGFPPFVVGLCEIENRSVLEDLVKAQHIAKYNYQIIHQDGPDHRGVDVGLLYIPGVFSPENVKTYSVKDPENPEWTTRDQLLVSGSFDGEKMHFIVINWPSRSGGQKSSEPKRILAANVTRHIIDSILELDPNSKIFIMGDFNDDPINRSIKTILKTKSKKEEVVLPYLYNPMEKMYKDGIGSLAYQDKWNLFDQIIITPTLLSKDKTSYVYYQAGIFNKAFLMQPEGRFKGYPFRTYVGDTFMGGYSDHFPAYMLIIKEKK
jgi:hypothetical protein